MLAQPAPRAAPGAAAGAARVAVGSARAREGEVVADFAVAWGEALRATPFRNASAPVIPNVTAAPTTDGDRLRELLIEQLTRPVLWVESMQALRTVDETDPLEVGPGKVLMGLMRRIDRGARVASLGDKAALDDWLAASGARAAE